MQIKQHLTYITLSLRTCALKSYRTFVTMSVEVTLRKANQDDIPSIVKICALSVAILNADNNFQWNDTYPLQVDLKM